MVVGDLDVVEYTARIEDQARWNLAWLWWIIGQCPAIPIYQAHIVPLLFGSVYIVKLTVSYARVKWFCHQDQIRYRRRHRVYIFS